MSNFQKNSLRSTWMARLFETCKIHLFAVTSRPFTLHPIVVIQVDLHLPLGWETGNGPALILEERLKCLQGEGRKVRVEPLPFPPDASARRLATDLRVRILVVLHPYPPGDKVVKRKHTSDTTLISLFYELILLQWTGWFT